MSQSTADKKALLNTVFLEARGEGKQGWVAVAHVIMNRAKRNKSYFGGSTVEGVCYKDKQFSCWDGRSKDLDINGYPGGDQSIYKEIKKVTDAIYDGVGESDPTGGADHYFNPNVINPTWKDNMTFTCNIGNHAFYKEK